MRAYLAVTDDSWYRFLSARPAVTEVNFWQPSGDREDLRPGSRRTFFFKTYAPHNKVVAGGVFSDSAQLRLSKAQEIVPGSRCRMSSGSRWKPGIYHASMRRYRCSGIPVRGCSRGLPCGCQPSCA